MTDGRYGYYNQNQSVKPARAICAGLVSMVKSHIRENLDRKEKTK